MSASKLLGSTGFYSLPVLISVAGPCLSWWQVKLWRHEYHSWYLSPSTSSSIYYWVGHIFPVLLSIALIVKPFNFHISDLEVSMALIFKVFNFLSWLWRTAACFCILLSCFFIDDALVHLSNCTSIEYSDLADHMHIANSLIKKPQAPLHYKQKNIIQILSGA